jgi:hypothetical protein
MFDRMNSAGSSGLSLLSGMVDPHQHPFRTRNHAVACPLILVLMLPLLCIGCAGTTTSSGDSPDRVDEGKRVFADDGGGQWGGNQENAPAVGEAVYTIRLMDVPEGLERQPDVAIASVSDVVGPGVRVIQPDPERPPMLVVGRFADPMSEASIAAQRRVRAIEVNGQKPFMGAVMVREKDPSPSNERLARFDLRNVKSLFGDEAVYTLQIGIYAREDDRRPSRDDLASFRKSAEEAVEALRRAGEQAFFYHGPSSSTVTVGIFDEDDIDLTVVPEIESPRLQAVRARHPHNLLNGAGVRERRVGSDTQVLQASRLVSIPSR